MGMRPPLQPHECSGAPSPAALSSCLPLPSGASRPSRSRREKTLRRVGMRPLQPHERSGAPSPSGPSPCSPPPSSPLQPLLSRRDWISRRGKFARLLERISGCPRLRFLSPPRRMKQPSFLPQTHSVGNSEGFRLRSYCGCCEFQAAGYPLQCAKLRAKTACFRFCRQRGTKRFLGHAPGVSRR